MVMEFMKVTSSTESAQDGSMVFTYNINDDDAVPFAFFKNVDGTTATESGSIDEGESKVITVALSSAPRKIFIYIILMPELVLQLQLPITVQ